MNNMKKEYQLQNKIANSKFSYTKNIFKFVIAPVLVLVVGLILLLTVNFNLGTDFAGSRVFKVYVNNEAILQGSEIEVFDIEKEGDYQKIFDKINGVLEGKNVKVAAYSKSSITLKDYNVYQGQAVEVKLHNSNLSSEAENALYQEIKQELLAEFGYADYSDAVTDIDEIPVNSSYWWAIGITASVVLTAVVAAIYMAIRYDGSALAVVLLMTALDVFLLLGLLLICRVSVNLTVGAVILTTVFASLINTFFFYSKIKNGYSAGKFEKKKNNEMADMVTRELTLKKSIVYTVLVLAAIIVAAVCVWGIGEIAIGILLALVTTFYTSQCLLPTIWAVCYRGKRRKNKAKKAKND